MVGVSYFAIQSMWFTRRTAVRPAAFERERIANPRYSRLPAGATGAAVTQIGNLPYRRLLIGEAMIGAQKRRGEAQESEM